MDYCTIQDVQDVTLKQIDIDYIPFVEKLISACTEYINGRTGRTPLVSNEITTRYYNGLNLNYIDIDLVHDITAITLNGQSIIGNITLPTYWTEPLYRLNLNTGVFTKGLQNIAITGKFGYLKEIPADLRIACAMLVGEVLPGYAIKGGVSSERIGDYSISYETSKLDNIYYSNPFIKGTIEKYSRII